MTPEKNIFLIDDDKLFVFLTKKSIQETDIVAHIKEFGDGQAAIEYIKEIASDAEQLPDIIFLDLSMPIMDGWEFLKEYIVIQPTFGKKVDLYIFSSSISPHDIERANNIGAVADFIIKPLKKDKIREILTGE